MSDGMFIHVLIVSGKLRLARLLIEGRFPPVYLCTRSIKYRRYQSSLKGAISDALSYSFDQMCYGMSAEMVTRHLALFSINLCRIQ
jgi:hypothetical protein